MIIQLHTGNFKVFNLTYGVLYENEWPQVLFQGRFSAFDLIAIPLTSLNFFVSFYVFTCINCRVTIFSLVSTSSEC